MKAYSSTYIVIVFCIFLHTFSCIAQNQAGYKFEQITESEGLSNNTIRDIYQDNQGYIWIGTLSGLNRYDGYEMKNYYSRGRSTNLEYNTIEWISAGPEGKIWVKNGPDISVYDPHTEEFIAPANYLKLMQTNAESILGMVADQNGNFWFNIENRGLVLLLKDNTIAEANSTGGDIKLVSNNIADMFLDDGGKIWLMHSLGVVEVLDPKRNQVIRKYGLPDKLTSSTGSWRLFVDSNNDLWVFRLDNPFGLLYLNLQNGESRILDDRDLPSKLVTGVIEYDKGEIWIGMDHGGVSVLDKSNWQFNEIKNDPDNPNNLSSDNVNVLFQDASKGVWVGSPKSGINYHHKGASNFGHYKTDEKEPAYNDMSGPTQDSKGNLWIGTNGKGLLYFDTKTGKFTCLLNDHKYEGKMPEVVVSLLYDSRGNLWIGSYLEGLFAFDGKTFRQVDLLRDEGLSVWDLFEDSKGNIWIGTLNSGIYKYDRMTGKTETFNVSNSNLSSNYVTCISEDHSGSIWIGLGSGVSVFDNSDNVFRNYTTNDDSKNPLSNNSTTSVYCDSRGDVWIGTFDGLNRYRANSDDFEVLYQEDGLSSNIIMSIVEDMQGSLWMSTSQGITKLSILEEGSYEIHSFDISDGLQAESFTENAGIALNDGRLIFSGQNGFNIFDPKEIKQEQILKNLRLTDLYISNRKISPGTRINDRVLLKKPIYETEDIRLNYDESSLAIDFAEISFYKSAAIRYQYKLDGFDQQWISATPGIRRATYTNLNPGDYVFHVRSFGGSKSNLDEIVVLSIHISPPFWKTPLAIVLYIITTLIVLYVIRKYIIDRERKKAAIIEERREVERQHQLDLMKIKFFTNISHEFRTPLSLILTPVERMIRNSESVKTSNLVLIQRNAKRLMALVNQLLDFRKMEANQHVLNKSTGDLVKFLQDITDSFSDLSLEKKIDLAFETGVKSFYTSFDKDKMERVMFNLLSNAFKFTFEGGRIKVSLTLGESVEGVKFPEIRVEDTGIGIPEEKMTRIFERFFQNDLPRNVINNGTGIGLSITKEFVELHGGEINVTSKLNAGSTFIVNLPLREIQTVDGEDEVIRDEDTVEADSASNPYESGKFKKDLPSVMLVDDNFDFRFYLTDNLKQFFNVFVAGNGKEAWRKILEDKPDIVVSDVMMPVMDGLELCRKINQDPRTSHIPVILLTAQTSDQHKIMGHEAGAIEHISKPFNFEILLSSINSALHFQKRVKEIKNTIEIETTDVGIIMSDDEKMINKAVELVEANMSNSEFSVEELSFELGFTRGYLYKKFLRLTKQTPIDFIRNVRMDRAAQLLEKSHYNVSEIAYKVGYNNPKLFTRYFKHRYRKTPSEYRNDFINT